MTTLPMPPYARDPDQADTDPQGIAPPLPELFKDDQGNAGFFKDDQGNLGRTALITNEQIRDLPDGAPRRALNTDTDWSQENASAEREKWRERMIIWGVGLLVAFFGGFLGIAAAQWALR